jgi:predicted O-methyltransferase YrrM
MLPHAVSCKSGGATARMTKPAALHRDSGTARPSIRQSFLDRIYDGIDPFASRSASGAPAVAATDALPDGWGSDHPYFKQYIELIRPHLIVEVGTWLGGSAVHMGRLLRAAGLNDSCIICVDTWLGSSEHFLNAPERRTLKLADGRATFYDDFLQNVVRHGLTDLIVPFSITSVAAAEVFREIQYAPDLIYLDGDHTVRGFRADLELYWEILRPGGALIGDDFDWHEIHMNVLEFAFLQKVEFKAFDNKFAMRKPA